jgi:hypothetical protein
MKTIRFAASLYAIILLVLLLFPPWGDGTWFHWKFSQPHHWVTDFHNCLDKDGHEYNCDVRVWEEDNRVSINYHALIYDAVLWFVFSVFTALMIDKFRLRLSTLELRTKAIALAIVNRVDNIFSGTNSSAKGKQSTSLNKDQTLIKRPPTIRKINPSTGIVGDSGLNFSIYGSNFHKDSVVFCGTTPLTTRFVSEFELEAFIEASLIGIARRVGITVTNSDGTSPAACLDVLQLNGWPF